MTSRDLADHSGLITDVQLAEQFGISVEELEKLRLYHHWPHVKLGRKHVRFTPAQVEAIVRQHSIDDDSRQKPSLGTAVRIDGQTRRSAARAR